MYFEVLPAETRHQSRQPPAWLQWMVLAVCLVFCFSAVGATGWWAYSSYQHQSGLTTANADGQPRTVTPRGELASLEKSVIELHKKTAPSVVHITTEGLQRDMYSRNVYKVPEGTGSGFVWDDGGHVVTNYHVIQKAAGAQVTLADGSKWQARLVGVAPQKDLAVLWIDAPKDKLVPITVGSSHDLQVGQMVFAIGNPFGLDQSLTMGIISALGREIESVTHEPIKDVIQTDAAINPGNSGGPLLDSAGRLIGVNTAIYSPSGASAGIGFAIPVDEVNATVPELIRTGKKF
jgi:S1-C subfamily serine protease